MSKPKIIFDYSKLKGKIKEVFDTQQNFQKALGSLSYTSIVYKLSNQIEFKQTEIFQICQLLGIEDNDIKMYFFTPKVEKSQPLIGGYICKN